MRGIVEWRVAAGRSREGRPVCGLYCEPNRGLFDALKISSSHSSSSESSSYSTSPFGKRETREREISKLVA